VVLDNADDESILQMLPPADPSSPLIARCDVIITTRKSVDLVPRTLGAMVFEALLYDAEDASKLLLRGASPLTGELDGVDVSNT